MHRQFCTVVATTLFFGLSISSHPNTGKAQDEKLTEVVAPMLWEISKDGSTSYLFGTIHITDKRCTTLHPLAQKAFELSDELYVETAPKDSFKQLNAITLGDDKKVSDVLSEEQIERINKQLADIVPNLDISVLPPLKVYAWPMVLPNIEAQMRDQSVQILDLKLVGMANEAEKNVGGLEEPSTQLSGMDALSHDEQVEFLEDALKSMEEADDEGEDPEAELAELYLAGDTEKMATFFVEEMKSGDLSDALAEKILKAMLYDRNQRMATKIDDLVSANPEKTYFFAAGTAHYLGDEAVQKYLKEKGYEIQRVTMVVHENAK